MRNHQVRSGPAGRRPWLLALAVGALAYLAARSAGRATITNLQETIQERQAELERLQVEIARLNHEQQAQRERYLRIIRRLLERQEQIDRANPTSRKQVES